MKKDWDIIVVGGGIAGLTTSLILSKLELSVLCIEPEKPPEDGEAVSADLRSTAYLVKSVDLFKNADIWKYLENYAEPLKVMRICHSRKNSAVIEQESAFDSKDINLPYFGYNLPNWITKKSLISALSSFEKSQLIFNAKASKITNRVNESLVKLSNNSVVSAKLIIGADGKNSDIRFLSNIKIKKWDEAQDAIAFVATHDKAHDGASIEILEEGGPCTLVPLRDSYDGKFQSAVVWMDHRTQAKKFMNLNKKDFSVKLSQRTKFVLGNCELNSGRTIYPIVSQLANKFYGDRMALIAEAAHVMPPIGAQGLNTSFEDIYELAKLLEKAKIAGNDLGAPNLLSEYGKTRRKAVQSKMIGISLLNKASKSNLSLVQSVRKFGLSVIDENITIKKVLMHVGIGNLKV